MVRVSERMRFDVASRHIEKAKTENVHSLGVLSSQKRINNLRDDPLAVTQLVKVKDRVADLDSFARNLSFASGYLDVSETAISSIHERLGRAHELAIAMANDSYGPEARRATSKEVSEVIDQIIQMANSKYNSRYIFSGFRTDSPALNREGIFLGDDGEIYVQIEQTGYKKININGRELFEANEKERAAGHFNMIDALLILKSAMEENDKFAIYKVIEEIDYQMGKATSLQASVGATANSLEQAAKQVEAAKEKLLISRSELEDADVYKATSDFKRTESVLQSTLLASNKLLQPSLLNFMQ